MIVSRCFVRSLLRRKFRANTRALVTAISNNIVNSWEPEVEIPNITLPELLTTVQNKFDKYVAIECAETKRKYTYGEIRDKSKGLSRSLRKILKLQSGDVVAIILRNIPEYPIANIGVMGANLIVTPVSPAFTAGEISRQLIDSDAKAVITEVELYTRVKSALQNAKKNIPILIIRSKRDENLPEQTINFHEFVEAGSNYTDTIVSDPDAVALMPYSSGTTGLPKGVELTHRNLVSNACQSSALDRDFLNEASESHQEVMPTILPFYHIFGQSLMSGLNLVGGRMITMQNFTQEMYISVLKNNNSTILFLVPPLVLMLTNRKDVKKEYLKHVKGILSGGAPLGASDEDQFLHKFGNHIFTLQGYGLTETSPCVSSMYPKIIERTNSLRGSIGRPVPNTLVKIVNPDDPKCLPLGPCRTGELFIKGPQIMKQYHNLPEETKKVITEDGWFKSGDLGHYDERGYLFITDRLKELIKVKGNQVAPAELEEVIRSFPGVNEAAVIGIPHKTSGEVPRAYVVARDELDLNKLTEFVNDSVARYKQLKGGIAIVKEIPKSAAGKLLRRELKDMYLQQGI